MPACGPDKVERPGDVERRHWERLTLHVEWLQDRAAGVNQDLEEPTTGLVMKSLGPRFKQ